MPVVEISESDSSSPAVPHELPQPHSTPPLAKFRQKSGSDIVDGLPKICDKNRRTNLGLRMRPREPTQCDNIDRLDVQGRVRDRSKSENDARLDIKDLPVIGAKKSRTETRLKISDEDVRICEDRMRLSEERMRRFYDKTQTSDERRLHDRINDDKFRSEFHDLHSSASDEGILSKELSSEEYLADKTEPDTAKGLESEGSVSCFTYIFVQ